MVDRGAAHRSKICGVVGVGVPDDPREPAATAKLRRAANARPYRHTIKRPAFFKTGRCLWRGTRKIPERQSHFPNFFLGGSLHSVPLAAHFLKLYSDKNLKKEV